MNENSFSLQQIVHSVGDRAVNAFTPFKYKLNELRFHRRQLDMQKFANKRWPDRQFHVISTDGSTCLILGDEADRAYKIYKYPRDDMLNSYADMLDEAAIYSHLGNRALSPRIHGFVPMTPSLDLTVGDLSKVG